MLGIRFTRKHWILCSALLLILALDQGTKAAVEYAVPLYGSIPVIHGFFSITHVKNTGAAFGLFAGDTSLVRTVFFISITIGAIILILFVFRKIRGNRVLVPLSLAMITAGAVGNLLDRIRWGHVLDFLDFHWHGYHWPAFNIADSAITVGVFLLLIENLFFAKKERGSEEADRTA